MFVGGGPTSLSVLARVLEPFPDEMTERDHKTALFVSRTLLQEEVTGDALREARVAKLLQAISVVDGSSARWLARWDRYFSAFAIPRLRSPVFHHPDPTDGLALRAYAAERGREGELTPIDAFFDNKSAYKVKGRSGQTQQWNNEVHRDSFVLPSAPLFTDFCQHVVATYDLDHVLNHGKVVDIRPIFHAKEERANEDKGGRVSHYEVDYQVLTRSSEDDDDEAIVTVETESVVLAIGLTNRFSIPSCVASLEESEYPRERVRHAYDVHFPPSMCRNPGEKKTKAGGSLLSFVRGSHILVVGGGLTAAHIANLALARGVDHVTIVTRSYILTRQFDVPIDWVGTFKAANMARLLSMNYEERLDEIHEVRAGGSIPPVYVEAMKAACKEGKLTLVENAQVDSLAYDPETDRFSADLGSYLDSTPSYGPDGPVVEGIHSVVLATGAIEHLETEPLVRSLWAERERLGLETVEGIPVLTPALEWGENTNIFVAGGYATLELGPWSHNLSGARSSAKRIAPRIRSILHSFLAPPCVDHQSDGDEYEYEESSEDDQPANIYDLIALE